jgi:hypothetical protein
MAAGKGSPSRAKREVSPVNALVLAITDNDWPAAKSSFAKIEVEGLWRHACLKIRCLRHGAPPDVAHGFHSDWTERGHSIREMVADDPVLLDALRILLPPYEGPDLLLYRGESARRHRQKRHGFAWTDRVDVARMFASGLNATEPEGGVLLSAMASSEAVIASPSPHSIYLGEYEYVVDRRRLTEISVVARFPPLSGNA